jgi:hypothetical protein
MPQPILVELVVLVQPHQLLVHLLHGLGAVVAVALILEVLEVLVVVVKEEYFPVVVE